MDEQLDIDLNVLIRESEHEYHAKAGEYLTSHLLADFRKCPLLYAKRVDGLAERRDTPAYTLGRAAHCRILEGKETFQDRYAFGGPINPKTGRPFGAQTKAFGEWAAAQGKPVLTSEQVELIENLATGVARNPQAVDLLLYGQAEGVVRAEYCGTPCQIRIDWLHPHHGIVDLKTCDDLTWFESDTRRLGYHRQTAFYRSVLAQVLGGLLVPVHLIAVEKKEPFRCGVWRVSDDTLAIAQRENEAAIRRLKVCREYGVKSIEKADGGYAKGYTHALTQWREVLDGLDALRNQRGMAVVLLAHAKVEKFEDPESVAYDRYSPRLHKHAAALVTEWCDAVLFATRKFRTETEDAGFNRKRSIALALGAGGGERVLRTVGGPSCIAKNRFGLPAELPLSWSALMAALSGNTTNPTNDGETSDG